MRIKRAWILGIALVAGAFLFVACGGGSTATSSPTPAPVPAATDNPNPTRPSAGQSTTEETTEPTIAGQTAATVTGYTWQLDTVDTNGAKPSLAVDADGVPHIAYLLEAIPGFVKYAVPNNDGWDISTIATGYFYGPLDIQVSSQGVPQISYHDHDNEDAAYAILVDGQWQVETISHPGHDGWDNNLAIDSSGRPHIVSIDPSQFGSKSGVEYATFDGQNWKVEEVGSGPEPYEFGSFIALDSQDRPHVVWFNDEDKDLKYATNDGTGWVVSTVESQGDVGRYASLAIDSQDNPVISYYQPDGNTSGYIKVARWDGAQWDIQRVDKLENVFTGFLGARKTSSIVLDGNDNPIVAYSDEDLIKLAVWDGGQWLIDTAFTADGDPFGQQVSMAIDGDGVLHLTFADVTSKSSPGVKGSVMYAKGTPGVRLAASSEPSSPGGGEDFEEDSSGQALLSAPATELVEPDPDFQQELAQARISTRGWKTDFSLHTVPYSEIFSGGVGRDGIPPLDNPQFTTPELADEWLGELEPVISFENNGEVKAYPLQILTWHEVANDVVGGKPVIVTFCPLCNTAIVFERTLDGVVHTFGVSGNLRNSDLIMWDRQTETWWQQLTGEGIVGAQAGKRLTFLPAPIISWSDFKLAHPEGQVLSRDTGFSRPYGQNPYVGYDRVDNPPFLFQGDLDGRLLPKERVAAFIIGDAAAAFPFPVLNEERVVNYNVGGTDLVVFFKPGTRTALGGLLIGEADKVGATGVFEVVVEGRKLTFRPEGDTFVDNETGSTWNILGQAVDGPMTGTRLTPIVHGNHFWFSWGVFQPDTEIYRGVG